MSEIESSTPASTSTRGPVGETRSVGLSILWFILTLGIYGIYWYFATHEEMKRHTGTGLGGGLGVEDTPARRGGTRALPLGAAAPMLLSSRRPRNDKP